MNRQEIETMPADKLNFLLAENVMKWKRVIFGGAGYVWEAPDKQLRASFNPARDRNDIAELIAAVTADAWDIIDDILEREFSNSNGIKNPFGWLLTCDPVVICRAVAVACCGGDA